MLLSNIKMRKKIIFITGGIGMVGQALLKVLYKKYSLIILDRNSQLQRNKKIVEFYKKKGVIFLKGDILNYSLLKKNLNGVSFVVHLAAMLGVSKTEKNPRKCLQVNYDGTKNVVKASAINKIKKIIFASSSEVYGEQKLSRKITENNPLLGKNVYARSKIKSENFIKKFLKKKYTKFTIVRLFNTYGEGQVAQFFIAKLCHFAKLNKTFVINGDGNQIRSYAYCSDIAEGINRCIDNKISTNKIYNLGNSFEVFSLKKVVDLLTRIRKKKIKIKFSHNFKKGDRKKNREIFNRICDTKKAKKDLKYSTKISLMMGLKKVINQKKIHKNWA